MENTDGAAAVAFTAQDPTTAASRILNIGPASSNSSQEGLPSEVVLDIFQHLDLHSLLKCRLVGSGFQSLIDSTASLQYKIELAVAGQRDGSYGDMFTRREMLKVHQKRWDGLQWTEVLRVPMGSDYQWRLCGGVLAQASSKPYTLHVKRIPSQSRGIKEKNWIVDLSTLLGEEARMGKFGMDPGQDLLVITARIEANESLRIHLLTLSKGERHPLTSEPYLVCHGLVSVGLGWVDICHDFLSIRSSGGALLWNWKTGQVLMHIVTDELFGDKLTSMVFLNERYVLMAIMGQHYPYLLAVDFLAEPPERRRLGKLENCFIFRFPSIPADSPFGGDYRNDIDIFVRSNPWSTWGADTDPSVPFSMVPQNRLVVVYVFDITDQDVGFVILEASFLCLIKTGLRVNNNHFDWLTWGPEHTRLLPHCSYLDRWVSPSHGTRLAMKRHLPHQGVLVNVYDFNQLGCRHKRQDSDEGTPGNVNVSESSEIIEGRPICVLSPTRIVPNMFLENFEADVDTRLGYVVTSWFVPGKTDGRSISAMCSEDAIVIADEANEMCEIYTV